MAGIGIRKLRSRMIWRETEFRDSARFIEVPVDGGRGNCAAREMEEGDPQPEKCGIAAWGKNSELLLILYKTLKAESNRQCRRLRSSLVSAMSVESPRRRREWTGVQGVAFPKQVGRYSSGQRMAIELMLRQGKNG
jgi:hypothetical protein